MPRIFLVALYSNTSRPYGEGVPDLHALLDQIGTEGIDTEDYDMGEQNPFQGIAERASLGGSQGATGQSAESLIGPDGYITGRATEFATKKDLDNYARTGSLATGDNGIGAFGQHTAGDTPFVAVSRSILRSVFGNERLANGKHVEVTAPNGKTEIIAIGDIGPRLENRANNAVLELNPGAKKLLGSGDSDGYRYRFID